MDEQDPEKLGCPPCAVRGVDSFMNAHVTGKHETYTKIHHICPLCTYVIREMRPLG